MASTTSGYDGSIRIDTKIDSKGFNDGMKTLDSSAKKTFASIYESVFGVGSSMTKMGKIGVAAFKGVAIAAGVALTAVTLVAAAVVALVEVLALVGVALVGLTIAAVKFGMRMVDSMQKAVDPSSQLGKQLQEIKDLIADIRGAFYAMIAPIVSAILPGVRSLSEWLVKIFNTVAMIIAKLLGQKTVLQYIAGSAKEADKLAKNTRKAGEAAEGALAAFDQINVLQTETADASQPDTAGLMKFEEVAVDDNILSKSWEKLKEIAGLAWDWIKEHGLRALQFLAIGAALVWNSIWEKFKEIVGNVWDRVKEGWNALWSGLRDVALAVWDRVKQGTDSAWEGIKSVFRALGEWFRSNVWNPLKEKFSEVWSRVKELASAAWGDVKIIWGMARDWFRVNVTDPIKNAFSSALNAIGGFFKSKFEAIKEVIVKVLNFIIDKINGLISRIVSGLNVVIGLLNKLSIPLPGFLGGGSIGFNIPKLSAPQIPRLATGAVIPPNSEFLAVMGDQRTGKNLEAPEELIRQIVREETSNTAGQEVTINFAGSMGSLIRAMKPYIDRENARVGKSLVRGIA